MFEQVFKNVDDVLWKEAGCTTELDYIEQTSWVLFLKYLDALEDDRATEAQLHGKKYSYLLDKPYRWESWAAPKTKDGKLDHNKALTGPDLIEFVNGRLFPYLHGFKGRASGPNTIEYKIGEIFGEIKNKVQSGYNLREIIDHIDELRFRSQTEKHELSHLYEAKIRNMGNAGRNGGEYYTPRPLIRAIIKVVKPKIGQRIYDGACGSAGFLCESFEYMKAKKNLTTKELQTLQERTFFGKEKKSLAYILAIMNMILHGIEAPNVVHTNTLTENLADIQDKDRFDGVMANPPFGGKERKEIQQNFPIRTGETAYLFLEHFIKILKAGGRAGIVIKNTFLSNTDNASISLRKQLLETCNLHTILDNPGGVFQGAGVKTVVLFFEKGAPTRKIWYYQLDPGRNLGKTNPLNDDDLKEFVELQAKFADSPKSWTVDIKSIDPETFDLSVKNPSATEQMKRRNPREIINEIANLEDVKEFHRAKAALQHHWEALLDGRRSNWRQVTIGEVCKVIGGGTPSKAVDRYWRGDIPWVSPKDMKSELVSDSIDHISPAAIENSATTLVPKGSVLVVVRSGILARTVPIAITGRELTINQDLKALCPDDTTDPRFLYWVLKARMPDLLAMVSRGATVHRLGTGQIQSIPFLLPTRVEQSQVVDQIEALLDECRRLEAVCQQETAALHDLSRAVLHQAFNGTSQSLP